MITSEAASLGVSIASGVLKLAGRVDRIRAEKQAVQGELVLPMPQVSGLPPRISVESQLRKLLDSTKDRQPDPVDDRPTIQALLDSGIVEGSNAALLSQAQAAQARVLADAPMPSGKNGSWRDEVSRIEAFISAHSDQPVTFNALRLALDAFGLIDSSQLQTERDEALYARAPISTARPCRG